MWCQGLLSPGGQPGPWWGLCGSSASPSAHPPAFPRHCHRALPDPSHSLCLSGLPREATCATEDRKAPSREVNGPTLIKVGVRRGCCQQAHLKEGEGKLWGAPGRSRSHWRLNEGGSAFLSPLTLGEVDPGPAGHPQRGCGGRHSGYSLPSGGDSSPALALLTRKQTTGPSNSTWPPSCLFRVPLSVAFATGGLAFPEETTRFGHHCLLPLRHDFPQEIPTGLHWPMAKTHGSCQPRPAHPCGAGGGVGGGLVRGREARAWWQLEG